MSTTAPAAAAVACSGMRNREIELTSRTSAFRSTVSARPTLWITLATELPLSGVPLVVRQLQVGDLRPVPIRPPGPAQVPAQHSSAEQLPCRATRHKPCAFEELRPGATTMPLTCGDAVNQGLMCPTSANSGLEAAAGSVRSGPTLEAGSSCATRRCITGWK